MESGETRGSDTAVVARDPAADRRGRDVFVGRQPIYDRELNLVAYELLFRRGDVASAEVVDGDEATFTVMLNALVEIGLQRLVGDKQAFINLTRSSVLCEYPQFFPPDKVVMEVLEDVTVDDELLRMVCKLSDIGYKIALDDFVYREELVPLLAWTGMVKLDVQELDIDEVRHHVERFKDLELLAEKVETREEFERCRKLGFHYFQGWFLGRPKVITVKHVPTSQLATLRLLSALHDDDTTEDDLAEIIRQDVSLSYRLMRTIDPANHPRPVTIRSVEDAIRLLGLDQLRQWVTLLSISGQDDICPELMLRSLVRARFCELLAGRALPEMAARCYVAGQLSVVDDLVGAPMEELIEPVALDPLVRSALLGGNGPAAEVLACARSCESGAGVPFLHLDRGAVRSLHEEARAWAGSVRMAMGY